MSAGDDALGILLNPDGEPYINAATGSRIRIGRDEIAGETYAEPVSDHARILTDNPDTDANEHGWVVDADGNRIGVESDTDPLTVSEGGYQIATEPGDITTGDDGGDGSGGEGDGEEGPGPSTGTVGTTNQYAVTDAVESVGEGDSAMVVAGIPLPGVYEITQSGEGRKSQYLRETQRGGANQREQGTEYPWEDNADDSEGDDSESNDSGGGDQIPPINLDIRAYVGSSAYEELAGLRTTPADTETFTVELGEIHVEDCELVELHRTLAGEQPTVYDARIKVREYREYEVIDNTVQQVSGDGTTDTTGSSSAPSGEFATPVREWTDRDGDGLDDATGEPLPEVQTTGSLNERLSGGDALENIHVTGSATIRASGDGWAIRNVGIEGPQQGEEPITLRGTGIVENLYVKDGDTGIFVMRDHGGDILIRFCHIDGFADNGVYASAPGNGPEHSAPGSGGRVAIEHCYGQNNGVADFRLGTDGSYVRDSVGTSTINRSYWGYYNHTRVINCDFAGDVVSGEDLYATGRNAVVELQDTRVGGNLRQDGGSFQGSSAGSPNLAPPDRVPMSAQEAANGRFYSSPPSGSL